MRRASVPGDANLESRFRCRKEAAVFRPGTYSSLYRYCDTFCVYIISCVVSVISKFCKEMLARCASLLAIAGSAVAFAPMMSMDTSRREIVQVRRMQARINRRSDRSALSGCFFAAYF